MGAVQSIGQIQDLVPAWIPAYTFGSMRMYNGYARTYAALYREQPNVRVCVDFLARNIAQLGLHVFRRVSDTDRKRLNDHPLARVLARPLPAGFKVSYYRLIESLMADLGIYFNAYWLKLKVEGAPLGLLRIPPEYVTPKGGLVITGYEVTVGYETRTIPPGEIVHFRGHNAESAITGLSPLETLRRILAEEHAAGDYREYFWKNAARQAGIIERPAGAPEWSDAARERFKAEFEALYSGSEQSGKTAILEEGMTWRAGTFSPQEGEYISGRKLTREECARAYHIPLPMVGILDHATFSNIKEQHKNLYQDSLGPWLAMIEDDVELQLLPEFGDVGGVYVEFNIAEKLQGSFEEQVTSLQGAVGRPWMTADEARARFNLPAMGGDAERLVTPLNVMVGGMASPRDTGPKGMMDLKATMEGIDSHRPELRANYEEKWAAALARHYRRQEAAVLSRLPKGAKVDLGGVWWDEERWDEELAADLLKLNTATAEAWANEVAAQLGADIDPDRMTAWLAEHSRIQAEQINDYTQAELEAALNGPDPGDAIKALFLAAVTVWARRQAQEGVNTASHFGAYEGARAGGLRSKTWKTNSKNPRPTHAAMAGVTVPIGSLFPNGMRWPGDPAGGAEEVANCQCSVVFNK
ncbi:MAG: phage portal protein [Anaerolineae bacterium]|nr:phage portal protein [Anaerolineae bacterium]